MVSCGSANRGYYGQKYEDFIMKMKFLPLVGVVVKTAGSVKNKMTVFPPTHNSSTLFLLQKKIQ